MYEPTWLHHVDRAGARPVIQYLPVDTLVHSGVGNRNPTVIVPLKCNQTDVAMAHGGLAKEVDAVFCQLVNPYPRVDEYWTHRLTIVESVHFMLLLGQVAKVIVGIHVLM